MIVEQLDKDFNAILEHIKEGSELYFIKESIATPRKEGGRGIKRLASTYVRSINIEDIEGFINDDAYALIKIS